MKILSSNTNFFLQGYYFNNPYFSCYTPDKYVKNYKNGKIDKVSFIKEAGLYFSLIKKMFKYVYKYELEKATVKIAKYVSIGQTEKANHIANQVNDIFYLWQYITNILWDKALYDTPACRSKEILKCLKDYWFCKKINILPVLENYEMVTCEEDGIDYMIIIDNNTNPNATPPNQVK